MTKLRQVLRALENSQDITIIRTEERNHLPNKYMGWSHTVDFIVAPKTTGVYSASKLQSLMMSLVPGLEPSTFDIFNDLGADLRFGKLYFDEEIGTLHVRREALLTDEDLFAFDGFVEGKKVIESDDVLKRRIWVRLYPDVQIATDAQRDGNEYMIKKNELPRYRGILSRLAKVLS
jgi:hypothetical protein